MEINDKRQFLRTKEKLEQKKSICSCGCNQEMDYLDSYGRPRKFIHGHNSNTIEHKQKVSKLNRGKTPWNKGRKERRLEVLSRISVSHKDLHPWNKGLKGSQEGWNKGLTKETSDSVKKISDSKLGHEVSETTRLKIRKTLLSKQEECFVTRRGYKNFTRYIKNLVRKRDNQICMLCGIHREKLKYSLDVHHINYDKHLSIEQNLITLCKPCHGKIGFNKKQWLSFFHSLLVERYNYKYEEDGDIILEIKNE
jgi:hypothetical protein